MDIRIGAPVEAEDGSVGRVERIIVDPQTHELVGIVTRDERALGRDVVIPAQKLAAADEHRVRYRGTVDSLEDLDMFALSQYTTPPEEWSPPSDQAAAFYLFPASPYTVGAFTQPVTQPDPAAHEVEDLDPGEVEVSGSTSVYCRDGDAGHIERVLTQGDTDEVTHLIVRRDGVGRHDVAVSVNQVARMGEDGIHLTLTRDELDALPEFEEE